MMTNSSPTKFSIATIMLMLVILGSVLFSKTLSSDKEHLELEIELDNYAIGDIE
jgi:hypothetical protein